MSLLEVECLGGTVWLPRGEPQQVEFWRKKRKPTILAFRFLPKYEPADSRHVFY